MLDNPYFAAPSSLPDDPGVYRGEGRIEEAEDGSSISIWWESTFAEAMELNLRLQKKLGIWRMIRRSQIALLVLGVAALLIAFFLRSEGADGRVMMTLCIFFGLFFCLLGILRPFRFKQSLKKLVIIARGGEGTIDARVIIDPVGIHTIAVDTETIFYWRSVEEIEVSNLEVTFIRQHSGLAQVPTRVFADSDALERFVSLGQKYLNVTQGRST